jgi:hypothetical protein
VFFDETDKARIEERNLEATAKTKEICAFALQVSGIQQRQEPVLNSVSAAASVCQSHTSCVLLSMHSVIDKLSGPS